MKLPSLTVLDAAQTARQLPYPALLDALAETVLDHAAGRIHAPERQVLEYPGGGVMLSMPAVAADIGVHKLVNVVPANRGLGLPTLNGVVTAYDGQTGCSRLVMDGPTVTARRTAAISMLGLRVLFPGKVTHAVIIGTGTEAASHAEALAALHPGLRITMVGRSVEKAQAFATDHAQGLEASVQAAAQVPDDAQVVITVTTSSTPVYDEEARDDRLIIGVGAYRPDLAEIGPRTLAGSRLYVDDLAGARHEAGDFLQAGVDWSTVLPLAAALGHESQGNGATSPGAGPQEGASAATGQQPRHGGPIVFKSVGCAAWDLAAARCAMRAINLE